MAEQRQTPEHSGFTEREFIEKAYTAAGEWTRFADPKAAGVLVFLGLGLADLLKHAAPLWNGFEGEGTWGTVASVAFVCGLLLAAAAVAIASVAVFPQLKPGGKKPHERPKSLFFYADIATFKTPNAYREALAAKTDRQRLDYLIDQTWAVAGVATDKHRRVRYAYIHVLLFLVAWAVARFALALS